MNISRFVSFSWMIAAVALLAGCMSAPTYGTGTRSDVQLLEDVSNIASLKPKKKETIDYKPRAGIVKPATIGELPAPQTAYANSEQWPESPEERRARIRAEATANQDNAFFKPSVVTTTKNSSIEPVNFDDRVSLEDRYKTENKGDQQKRFREQLATKNGAYQERRYLSDPPSEYKQPLESAPSDELGEDEKAKERRRLAAAKKKDGFKLPDLWPF